MNKIAVFPGSFDPFTIGHESVVKRASTLFDKIIIAIGYNSQKNSFFSLETRKKIISKVFENVPNVEIKSYSGMTIDFCKEVDSKYILRGLRTAADFEYERAIAQMNLSISGIETVFLLTLPEHSPISSSIVREILRFKGDASKFIPASIVIENYLEEVK